MLAKLAYVVSTSKKSLYCTAENQNTNLSSHFQEGGLKENEK